jgi:hypothetical protein
VGFSSAHPGLEDAGIILDELSYRLSTKTPHARKLTDPVMLLKAGFSISMAASTSLWSRPSM